MAIDPAQLSHALERHRPAKKVTTAKERVEGRQRVARQFESIFVTQLLKEMRASGQIEKSSLGQETFTGMFDEKLAQTVTTSRSLGIADLLMRQWGVHPSQLEDKG